MSTATLSAPFLIDGISYVKVFIALLMSSCVMPFILIKVLGNFSPKLFLGFLLVLLLLNFYFVYLNTNSYRSVFGAPGRHNGFLSALVCIYFFLIGIYFQKFSTILDVYKSIAYVSVFTSLCILSMSTFDFGTNSIFASNNFLSRNFAENSNLIAPLLCAGFVTSLVSYRKTKTHLYLLFLIPISLVIVRLSLIQTYVVLSISLLILGVSNVKRHFSSAWLPVVILSGYLVGLLLGLQGVLDGESSIKERINILREGYEIKGDFTFLPANIDALSDFTENFAKFNEAQFLDDFHNVFLQTTFSFGLLIGLLFFLLSLFPYLVNTLLYKDKLEFLSVYTSLFVSLLIGISSPNFIYIYFIFLGYSGATFLKVSDSSKYMQFSLKRIAWILAALLFVTPLYVQVRDMNTRLKISDRAQKVKALNDFKESNFKDLLVLLSEIDDAEYRTRMALNFYAIGQCKYGDLVYGMIDKTNPDEARLRGLEPVKNGCSET